MLFRIFEGRSLKEAQSAAPIFLPHVSFIVYITTSFVKPAYYSRKVYCVSPKFTFVTPSTSRSRTKAGCRMSTHASSESPPDLDLAAVYLAGKPQGTRWDICCRKGQVTEVAENKALGSDQEKPTQFVIPSLCHPHIHLDKCFLLSHPKYADLEIETGGFAEALKLTSRFLF